MFYTITTYYDPIGSKKLTNRCPNCGSSDSLELNFYQKRVESPFSSVTTKKISGVLYCHKTKTEISPVQWSDDIERIFNVEKQRLKIQPKSIKFSKWFYGLLIFFTIGIITAVSLFTLEVSGIKNVEDGVQNVKVGDKFEVFYSNSKLTSTSSGVYTWFLVKSIDGNIVRLQRHKNLENEESSNFELDNSNFTEEVLEVRIKDFQRRSFNSADFSKNQFTGLITDVKKK